MRLSMIGIVVKDMSESIKFYEFLGFKIKDYYSDDYVELEHDGIRISLNTKTMIEEVYGFEPTIKGERIELAFEMPSAIEIDTLVNKLVSENYKIVRTPWKTAWGQYYAIIKDTDGNILSLFCNLD